MSLRQYFSESISANVLYDFPGEGGGTVHEHFLVFHGTSESSTIMFSCL